MLTAVVALLVSLASFAFAVLVYAENRRLEREKHRAVALSATHTAGLLLGEALDVIGRVDAFLASTGLALGEEDAERYERYRRDVKADHDRVVRSMSEVAFADLAVVECREIAARSTLIVHRTIEGRKGLLGALTALRASVEARSFDARGDGAIGDGALRPPAVGPFTRP